MENSQVTTKEITHFYVASGTKKPCLVQGILDIILNWMDMKTWMKIYGTQLKQDLDSNL